MSQATERTEPIRRAIRSTASLLALFLFVTPVSLAGHLDEPAMEAPAEQPAFFETITPVPASPPVDAKVARLGRQLFFDPTLSRDGTRSCGSCHRLPPIGPKRSPLPAAEPAPPFGRDLTPLYNRGLAFWFNWDARYTRLSTTVQDAFLNPEKLDNERGALESRLQESVDYTAAFQQTFNAQPSLEAAAQAITTFLATLNTPDSRFDRFLNGDISALNDQELAGYALFKEIGCISCHNGVLMGENLLEQSRIFNFGTYNVNNLNDKGLHLITGKDEDLYVFRVPSLRNVALTPPYFHDGSAPTLEAAVAVMATYLLGIELASQDTLNIVAFMKTLTGYHPGVDDE